MNLKRVIFVFFLLFFCCLDSAKAACRGSITRCTASGCGSCGRTDDGRSCICGYIGEQQKTCQCRRLADGSVSCPSDCCCTPSGGSLTCSYVSHEYDCSDPGGGSKPTNTPVPVPPGQVTNTPVPVNTPEPTRPPCGSSQYVSCSTHAPEGAVVTDPNNIWLTMYDDKHNTSNLPTNVGFKVWRGWNTDGTPTYSTRNNFGDSNYWFSTCYYDTYASTPRDCAKPISRGWGGTYPNVGCYGDAPSGCPYGGPLGCFSDYKCYSWKIVRNSGSSDWQDGVYSWGGMVLGQCNSSGCPDGSFDLRRGWTIGRVFSDGGSTVWGPSSGSCSNKTPNLTVTCNQESSAWGCNGGGAHHISTTDGHFYLGSTVTCTVSNLPSGYVCEKTKVWNGASFQANNTCSITFQATNTWTGNPNDSVNFVDFYLKPAVSAPVPSVACNGTGTAGVVTWANTGTTTYRVAWFDTNERSASVTCSSSTCSYTISAATASSILVTATSGSISRTSSPALSYRCSPPATPSPTRPSPSVACVSSGTGGAQPIVRWSNVGTSSYTLAYTTGTGAARSFSISCGTSNCSRTLTDISGSNLTVAGIFGTTTMTSSPPLSFNCSPGVPTPTIGPTPTIYIAPTIEPTPTIVPPPNKPSGLGEECFNSTCQIRLSWDPSDGASWYSVSSNPPGGLPKTTSGTSVTFDLRPNNVGGSWSVTAHSDITTETSFNSSSFRPCCTLSSPHGFSYLSPADGSEFRELGVPFSWQIAGWGSECCYPGIRKYEVYVLKRANDDDYTGGPLDANGNSVIKCAVSTDRLAASCGGTFTDEEDGNFFVWQVKATNRAGRSGYSTVSRLEVNTNPDPWFESGGADVHGQGGIKTPLPDGDDLFSTADDYTDTPGVVSHGDGTDSDFGEGEVSDEGWLAEDDFINYFSYEYFEKKLDPAPTGGSTVSLDTLNGGGAGLAQVYSGNLTITGGMVGGSEKISIFSPGDVTIGGDIEVAPGGYLGIFASGTITINGNVEKAEGVFFADGQINTCRMSGTNACGNEDDNPLVIEGALLSRNGGIFLGRSLDDNEEPAEKIIFRPDLLFNSPKAFWSVPQVWQELAP